MNLLFVCQADNDVYRCLTENGYHFTRYDQAAQAVHDAQSGSGVVILADAYPCRGEAVSDAILAEAQTKSLRLYVEYPSALGALEFGDAQHTVWERGVVCSDFFGQEAPPMQIAAIHGCWYLPVTLAKQQVHLAVARVAGYDKAVFGLPEKTAPVLFQYNAQTLVATTGLSRFISARYAPHSVWKAIWQGILNWLTGGQTPLVLTWQDDVRPTYTAQELLKADAEMTALKRNIQWFRDEVIYRIDAKVGAFEGFESGIDAYGNQRCRPWARGDCTGETALVMALEWTLTKNPDSKRLAEQILDYVWSSPDFAHEDPSKPEYGLNNWAERIDVFYGDDNARVILPTLAARRLLGSTRWDEKVLRCLLANLRTTGALGFRHNRIDLPQFYEDNRGWEFFYDENFEWYAPHYGGYLWACFLWAYELTGYEGFLTRTKNAIRKMMEVYPHWRWTNGFTQEQARMVLPLVYLVKIEDTPEHRSWLRYITEELLKNQVACGTIREQMGDLKNGNYPSPQCNEHYGVNEASLIQENGDPACDLLYTINYAFLGLHEAAMITGEALYKEAADKLADFLCRVQASSTRQRYLDGCWLRAFDYKMWDYWGSSADTGWGAWCVESGWTNTWIASILALRHMKQSLYDGQTLADPLRRITPAMVKDMLTKKIPS